MHSLSCYKCLGCGFLSFLMIRYLTDCWRLTYCYSCLVYNCSLPVFSESIYDEACTELADKLVAFLNTKGLGDRLAKLLFKKFKEAKGDNGAITAAESAFVAETIEKLVIEVIPGRMESILNYMEVCSVRYCSNND